MTQSPNLTLPYIQAAQAQKHVTHNEALRVLDAVVQLAVLDRDLAVPPVSPADGARYIVAASPSGAWVGQANAIAAYQDGAWAFYAPREGWITWISDEDIPVVWNGSSWTGLPAGGGPAQFTQLGVNAVPDAINKLSVNSAAALFNHIGNGVQIKVNKAAAADSASFLFQTAFSGRAEIGTTGDDDFHFKVSPDGTTFREALILNKTTGAVAHLAGARATFAHDATSAGFNLVPAAGDPSAPANGDLWYNATSGKFRKREGGTTSDLSGAGGGSVTQVNTGTGLTGGPITGAGTVSMANMAANSLKGNNTGASAAPADLTAAQVKSMLVIAAADVSGLATIATTGSAANLTAGTLPAARFDDTAHGARAGGTLHANATTSTAGFMSGADKTKIDGVAANANNYVHPNHSGDVTSVADGATTIAANAVTYAKMQDVSANSVLARANAVAGDVGEVAIGASQLFGRGATGDLAPITLGTNLSMSGTTLNATGGGGGGSVATDTIWDAKGDLAAGTGADTAARLPVGTNGQVLTADSAEATGLKWATVSGTGTVTSVGTSGGLTGGPITGSGTISISDGGVTNAKLADMAATTIKGNSSGSTAAPADLTAMAVANMLPMTTVQTFTASGTWTKPTGCRWIKVRMVGGGGGGGGATAATSNLCAATGGQGGGYAEGFFDVTATANLAVTIGAAGAAGAAANGNGGAGGTTSLGAILSATGGTGGTAVASGTAVNATATNYSTTAGTGGYINCAGQPGSFSNRESGTVGASGFGGSSPFGAGGYGRAVGTVGQGVGITGTGYGAGGGGAMSTSTSAFAGGAGTAGFIIVEEYY